MLPKNLHRSIVFAALCLATAATRASAADPRLDLGLASHAFDHLGPIADQAPTAAGSGASIIYTSGIGSLGYEGLPAPEHLDKASRAAATYLQDVKKRGIKLAVGYVCATSIVKLKTFDKNWSPEFRAQLATRPSEWLQRDKDNKPLTSWYGGDYSPACMNNPDWRLYEKAIVRRQIEAGCDGIFFDNPTVHEKGCYCDACMERFASFMIGEGAKLNAPPVKQSQYYRDQAIAHPKDFARFRCTIARDFLADMRSFARKISPTALITCNNSLNSPDVFFSQCRGMAYNIYEMSKTEDFVCLEDMATQPRTLANGQTVEYGPVYEAVAAIAHGKPIVAVTIADGDYHTPPNLVRLAMAEAVAHGASYLSWPTWPEEQRARMSAGIRPQADFLRENANLLNGVAPVADVIVFLPFREWQQTADCKLLAAARALGRENVQFKVVCEDDIDRELAAHNGILLFESEKVLLPAEAKAIEAFKCRGQVVTTENANWLADLKSAMKTPAITVEAPPTVRVIVREKPGQTIVHLLNLNIERLSSFEDRVTPARDIKLHIHVPLGPVESVGLLTADKDAMVKKLQWTRKQTDSGVDVVTTIPHLSISALVVVE